MPDDDYAGPDLPAGDSPIDGPADPNPAEAVLGDAEHPDATAPSTSGLPHIGPDPGYASDDPNPAAVSYPELEPGDIPALAPDTDVFPDISEKQ